jgi:chromate reductase
MRVLGIAGSLRSGSLNRELLRLASESTPDGIELEVWEGLRDIPPFDADSEYDEPASVAEFRDAVRSADAVLISTPEYNHSVPGQLKNALDWASRPELTTCVFRNKPVAVVSASTGMFGGVWAQEDAKKILGAMGARVVDSDLALARAHERLADPNDDLVDGLRTVLADLSAECAPQTLANVASRRC